MLKAMLISIVSKYTSNIKVDDSKEINSAIVTNSKIDSSLDNQPTFLYSKESLEQLRKVFPLLQWSKKLSIEDLAHNAGQQSIIEFIERRLGKEAFKVLK